MQRLQRQVPPVHQNLDVVFACFGSHIYSRKFNINIAPGNLQSQGKNRLPSIIFQGRAVKLRGCTVLRITVLLCMRDVLRCVLYNLYIFNYIHTSLQCLQTGTAQIHGSLIKLTAAYIDEVYCRLTPRSYTVSVLELHCCLELYVSLFVVFLCPFFDILSNCIIESPPNGHMAIYNGCFSKLVVPWSLGM